MLLVFFVCFACNSPPLRPASINALATAQVADTWANWVKLFDGEDSTMTKDIRPLKEQWERTNPDRVLVLEQTCGSSRVTRATLRQLKNAEHAALQKVKPTRIAQILVLFPEAQAAIPEAYFRAIVAGDASKHVRDKIDLVTGYSPSSAVSRFHPGVPDCIDRLHSSKQPNNSTVRLRGLVFHCSAEAPYRVSFPDWHSVVNKKRPPRAIKFVFSQLQRHCVHPLLTCGYWLRDEGNLNRLVEQAVKLQCVLVGTEVESLKCEGAAATAAHRILDFSAALLTRGLLDMVMIEHPDGDAKSAGGFDKLYTGVIEPLFQMLRDGAADTRIFIINHRGEIIRFHEQERVRVPIRFHDEGRMRVPTMVPDDDHHMNAAGEIAPAAVVSLNPPALPPQQEQDFCMPVAGLSLISQTEPIPVVYHQPRQPRVCSHGDRRSLAVCLLHAYAQLETSHPLAH